MTSAGLLTLESIQEIQLELERAEIGERRAQGELTMLFEALQIINEFGSRHILFSRLLDIFKKAVRFEEAFILASDISNSEELVVVFATNVEMASLRFPRGPFFTRLRTRGPVSAFEVGEIDEWKAWPNDSRIRVRSALHIPIQNENRPAILVCTHSKPGFFGRGDFEISRKFSVLLSQALANLDYTSALEQEISERKRTEKLLAEQQIQFVQASKMAALGEMAGGIAHEVNNPLAIIRASAEQLDEMIEESTFEPVAARKYAATIVRTVTRIATIVTGLRSFSRDGTHDPFEKVPLRGLVDNVLALCRQSLADHGIRVVCEFPTEVVPVECRPVQIEQVLLNLIGNSRDAVRDSSEKWIRIALTPLPDKIRLEVTDSGPGVPETARAKLFQPFFTTKEIGKGTGLGLSISRSLIELHRGTLEYVSGCLNTTFRIELPRA
jgi:C4-dicarboxylate-specific signal transduction histidine kinase